MKLTVLGSSGGIPITNRAQSGILIQTSKANILLDCGMGVPLRLKENGVEAEEIDLLCISHKHLDHIQDLPSLTKASWLRTDKAEYDIACHLEIKDHLINFWKASEEYERADFNFVEMRANDEIEYEEIKIKSFKTDHTDYSLGFKISHDGNNIVYTSDTSICDSVRENADGVNLLIHEISFTHQMEGHTTPEEMMDMLSDINVGELIITHFYPEVEERLEEIVSKIEDENDISVTAAYDLQEIIL